jgi:glycosyltransferase involved in cell wall biosynthesis
LEAVKGPEEAVRILSLLPGDFHLDVLGEGAEHDRLSGLVGALKLVNRVTFHGWVDSVSRDKWLASAGVLLMPSLWDEGFGMAGVEAFAQGTPVIAYDVGGVAEWCGRGAGRLVPCGDIRAAALAVRELTNDSERWLMYSRAAKDLVESEFPRERFGRELDEVLAAAIKRA